MQVNISKGTCYPLTLNFDKKKNKLYRLFFLVHHRGLEPRTH